MYHHPPRLFFLAGACVLMAGAAQAEFFHIGSGSIDGSLCVGNDCVSAEAFGFDTFRLRENNLRVHFDDTSSSGSFPNRDWRLVANASANGGAEFFGIQDATANFYPFYVSGNARANALYIDSQGDVGLGTTTPALDIDIKTGNTPGLRLQQDGSSGFSPQTWDIAGNESSFFIRDATNGSTLPFRIRPGAPSNALNIDTDGSIGIGTLASDGTLHTSGPGVQLVYFESSDNNAVQVRMRSDSGNRRFLATDGSDNVETQIVFDNNQIQLAGATNTGANLWAVIDANGITTQGPDCGSPCDLTFDPEHFTVPPIEERAAYMWENMHLPAVGPTGPDQPFNVTEKTAGMLHELEIAHIYIEQLNTQMKAMQADHAARIADLTARLESLETR